MQHIPNKNLPNHFFFFWVHLCPLRDVQHVLYVRQYFLVWGTPVPSDSPDV
jgi:hypothetical protein